MTPLKNILSFILLLQLTVGFACDCSPIKDHDKLIETSFNQYAEIFIGEIFEKDEVLWIKVKEVFKGSLEAGQIIKTGFEGHSCSYYFGLEGLGLFYGQVNENKFFADLCSPTRMFDRPHLYPPPPPPVPGSKHEPEIEKQKMKKYEEVEKKRLEYEIEKLRKTSANNK
jgi:hypothetical protein